MLLVVANMVGAGLFTTSGFTLHDLGSAGRVVIAWIIGGFVAWCGAIGYANATKRLTESGGEYLFLSRWIHPAAGYATGWVSLIAGFSGAIATAALAITVYLPPQWNLAQVPHSQAALATILIVGMGILHALARQRAVWIQNVAVIAKLVLISVLTGSVFIGGWGQAWPGAQAITGLKEGAVTNTWSQWGMSLMYISFCYSGFNAAVYVAGEAREGARTVARAMMWGTGLVAILYIALNTVMIYGVPSNLILLKEDIAGQVIRHLLGDTWDKIFRGTVVLCLATSVSSMVFAGPPVYVRMARDGALPHWLVPRGAAPTAATALQVLVAVMLVWVGSLRSLLPFLGMTLALSTAGTVAAALWVRTAELEERESTITFWGRAAAIAYLGFTLVSAGLAFYQDWRQGLATVVTLAIGAVFWLVRTRRMAVVNRLK